MPSRGRPCRVVRAWGWPNGTMLFMAGGWHHFIDAVHRVQGGADFVDQSFRADGAALGQGGPCRQHLLPGGVKPLDERGRWCARLLGLELDNCHDDPPTCLTDLLPCRG